MKRLLLLLVLCTAAGLVAQVMHPTFRLDDPDRIVNQRMSILPKALRLTPKQRKGLRGTYIALSSRLRDIRLTPGGRVVQRQMVKRASDDADAKIRKLLNARQYSLLKSWEQERRQPARH